MAAAIRKMFGRGGVPSDAKRGSVASSLDENCLEGWVWKQKRNTAMVPGYRKVAHRDIPVREHVRIGSNRSASRS